MPTRIVDLSLAEQVAHQYAAAMDSVTLLLAGKPSHMTDDEWSDCVQRNCDHLDIMLVKDYWTTEDLQPFRDAIAVSSGAQD